MNEKTKILVIAVPAAVPSAMLGWIAKVVVKALGRANPGMKLDLSFGHLNGSESDSVSSGVLRVFSNQGNSPKVVTVRSIDLLSAVLSRAAEDGQVPEVLEKVLTSAFSDPTQRELLTQLLRANSPEISQSAAEEAAKELQETGKASYLIPDLRAGQIAYLVAQTRDPSGLQINIIL